MNIETIKLDKINPAKYNPRKDLQPGDPEYESLKNSIQEFGMVDPLVWNERSGNLVGGHQRMKVLKELGYTETGVSVVDMDDAKEKALNIALNKISGDWDVPKLELLMQDIMNSDIDAEITGFNKEEIEGMFLADYPENATAEKEDKPPVLTMRFENPDDVRKMESDIKELLKKYQDVSVTVSCGEV